MLCIFFILFLYISTLYIEKHYSFYRADVVLKMLYSSRGSLVSPVKLWIEAPGFYQCK